MNIPANILLSHGGGGQLMDQLLDEVVRPHIANDALNEGLDSGFVVGARPETRGLAPHYKQDRSDDRWLCRDSVEVPRRGHRADCDQRHGQ